MDLDLWSEMILTHVELLFPVKSLWKHPEVCFPDDSKLSQITNEDWSYTTWNQNSQ